MISFRSDLEGVDWEALRLDLIGDDFHNGRSTDQLRVSFENSQHVAIAFDGGRCIGTARALSDGVGNAYLVDVWTHSDHRRRGVARAMVELLLDAMGGQHVYLQTDEAVDFWRSMGFDDQPRGMSRIVGHYLEG
ncbi:MAG: GNAT family N-acetyltransferase [Acidimicrobiales bacterium]